MDSLDSKIGTTGRGLGPTYADKINRIGLRFGDLSEVNGDSNWAESTSERMNASLDAAGSTEMVSKQSLLDDISWICDNFSSAIANTGLMLDNALKLGENVILENDKNTSSPFEIRKHRMIKTDQKGS